MSPEEMNREIENLRTEAQALSAKLDAARDQRTALQKERFDLKEQRRYFRAQLREAKAQGNEERIDQVNLRLEELEQKLTELDRKIDAMEHVIDDLGDQMDDISDDLDDIMEDMEHAEEAGDGTIPVEGEVVGGGQNWGEQLERTMEKLNDLLTRGFKKAADTLESIDFEKMGENVQSAAAKAAKTVSGVANDAAKTVENAWNDAKEKSSQPGGVGDCRVSGSSVIDGGCYNRISASGSCKVSSDLVCRELRCSGSFKALGGVDCSGPVRVSGAFHCEKDLLAGEFNGSGSTKVLGNMTCGNMNVPGSVTVGGRLSAKQLQVSGMLRTGGDVEADSFSATGSVHVEGMVNADQVTIHLRGESQIGAIGGAQVQVTQSSTTGFFNEILRNSALGLTCDSIEGDTVNLTAVKAQVVRGANVTIHSGCDIETVEYTGTCTVDSGARVGNCVKL